VHEIAAFLAEHAPFDALEPEAIEQLADAAQIEYMAAGTTVLAQGAPPVDHVWVVRRGALELLDHGRLLDLASPGELVGHASMLSGLPTGFAVRASEDTLCYRLPSAVATPLLTRPEALPFVARSLLSRAREPAAATIGDDPLERPVANLIRSELVRVRPDETIRAVARRMTEAGVSAAVIDDDGTVGILTDRDLRSRVVGGDVSRDDAVAAAMTRDAHVVAATRPGTEAVIEMLERGVRHLPVVSPVGEVIGIVDDTDLMAAETHTPFQLRRAIGRAASPEELATAAQTLRPTVVALHDAGVAPERIGAVISVVTDALTRRLIELDLAAHGDPGAPFDWMVLGSLARREGVASSDVDSALVWHGDNADPALQAAMLGLAGRVMDGLERCGLPGCEHGAVASKRLFARSQAAWNDAVASWLEDPTQEKALILVSLLVDGRYVWAAPDGSPRIDAMRPARDRPQLLRLVARFALQHRPPTGFLRDLVVEHSGEHAGRLDLKAGGALPITDLARWAGLAAGMTSGSTRERLRAAADGGTLPAEDARTLEEAFDLVFGLRLDHQVEQLRRGEEPDDFIDPKALNPLAREYLKEAFRAVASVQKRVAGELGLRPW
jgi:CBS domain-containing protein